MLPLLFLAGLACVNGAFITHDKKEIARRQNQATVAGLTKGPTKFLGPPSPGKPQAGLYINGAPSIDNGPYVDKPASFDNATGQYDGPQGADDPAVMDDRFGPNCKGDFWCQRMGKFDLATLFLGYLELMPPENRYLPGSAIICHEVDETYWVPVGKFVYCLFWQGVDGPTVTGPGLPWEGGLYPAWMRNRLYEFIQTGHCESCGSVPVALDDDSLEHGILTINYVASPGQCRSICNPQGIAKAGPTPDGPPDDPDLPPGSHTDQATLPTKSSSVATQSMKPLSQISNSELSAGGLGTFETA